MFKIATLKCRGEHVGMGAVAFSVAAATLFFITHERVVRVKGVMPCLVTNGVAYLLFKGQIIECSDRVLTEQLRGISKVDLVVTLDVRMKGFKPIGYKLVKVTDTLQP